jgi:hypothetical protein
MGLDLIPVTFMYRPGPVMVTVATADMYGSSEGVYSVGVGFDMPRRAREKAMEFGRLLRWVLRNDIDCDTEMWSPLSRSE